jgi:plasmid maintenance system antidote protein VapI
VTELAWVLEQGRVVIENLIDDPVCTPEMALRLQAALEIDAREWVDVGCESQLEFLEEHIGGELARIRSRAGSPNLRECRPQSLAGLEAPESPGEVEKRVTFQRALIHAAKASFLAAALVEAMVCEGATPELLDLVLRLNDIIREATSARAELLASSAEGEASLAK